MTKVDGRAPLRGDERRRQRHRHQQADPDDDPARVQADDLQVRSAWSEEHALRSSPLPPRPARTRPGSGPRCRPGPGCRGFPRRCRRGRRRRCATAGSRGCRRGRSSAGSRPAPAVRCPVAAQEPCELRLPARGVTAMTRSPACRTVRPRGISSRSPRVRDTSTMSSGSPSSATVRPSAAAAPGGTSTSTMPELPLLQRVQADDVPHGQLLLDELADDRRRRDGLDAEGVEGALVARAADPRDHPLHAEAQARELAGDEVVLVAGRHRGEHVGPIDPGVLERAHVAAVAFDQEDVGRNLLGQLAMISDRLSMTLTACPLPWSVRARNEPTSPPPLIATNMSGALLPLAGGPGPAPRGWPAPTGPRR